MKFKTDNACPICGRVLHSEQNHRLVARYIPHSDWWVIEHIKTVDGKDLVSCARAGFQFDTEVEGPK